MMEQPYHLSPWEATTGELTVQGQPKLHNMTTSKKERVSKKKKLNFSGPVRHGLCPTTTHK